MARKHHELRTDPANTSASQQRPPLYVAQLPTEESGRRPIQRVLIANRGEIACRVIATCKKLDLTSIAIYAEEDAASRHVSQADEAISLGSISQAEGNPFLNVQLLVDVATSARADAIHPGYGYLSENAFFADAVRQAAIIFIGPSAEAMSALGDKRNSKDYLREHDPKVPLVPGFSGSGQNVEDLEAAAEQIGYPVILKASAGGGGRGMRIVRERSKLKEELERAKSEAQRSFGSDDCILEKYINQAKHIEVQIIGDSHGKVLSLWERECSVQRRYQKVIEETPSPFLTPEQRQKMCATAVRIGELIGYEGAGTVEFVVDAKSTDASFYFLEVNTRLQVEHPITEEVTGLDIVALQLFAAAGGSFTDLPLQRILQNGHAIECRLCAEDPSQDFRPENGTIRLWKEAELAKASRDIRYETSVQTNSNVSIHFDSMIAKIVVWAPTRALAISKMVRVLANTSCIGVRTNQVFLQSCLLHSSFQDPAYTTSLITNNIPRLLSDPYSDRSSEMIAMLSVIPEIFLRTSPLSPSRVTREPFQHVRRGFRVQKFDPVNLDKSVIVPVDSKGPQTPLLLVSKPTSVTAGQSHTISLLALPRFKNVSDKSNIDAAARSTVTDRYNSLSAYLRGEGLKDASNYDVQIQKYISLGTREDTWLTASIQARINTSIVHAYIATPSVSNITSAASQHSVFCHFPALGTWFEYKCYTLLTYFESLRESGAGGANAAASKEVKAPMPCKVLSVIKRHGEEVEAGEVVMVIESMKMETNITIPVQGKFQTTVKEGDAVEDGKVLCWVE